MNVEATEVQHSKINLEPGWLAALQAEFSAPYMVELKRFLQERKRLGKIIYPRGAEILRAFEVTPLDAVRVVILGQDPYHGPGQAHGLCFSVPQGVRQPPSLQNMFKELQTDLGIPPAAHGDLTSWAQQGVLLLNSVLTVEQGNAGSHQNKGWEQFTDAVIKVLNARERRLIFVLWGSYAHNKGQLIDARKHVVLRAAHPSPFSVHRGFFGCKHFSQINTILQGWGEQPISWALPSVS